MSKKSKKEVVATYTTKGGLKYRVVRQEDKTLDRWTEHYLEFKTKDAMGCKIWKRPSKYTLPDLVVELMLSTQDDSDSHRGDENE